MDKFVDLGKYLEGWAGADANRQGIARAIEAFANAGKTVSAVITAGELAGALAAVRGENTDGDAQKELDVRAHEMICEGLRAAPVAFVGSEEAKDPVALNAGGTLVVNMDPLDGSSNIDTNVSVGTIFSILPGSSAEDLLQEGSKQLAAGFVIYGPQTVLVLSVGEGTHAFTLDPTTGQFRLTREDIKIPRDKKEYAINASNYRFWDEAVRAYIDDCIAGEEGPRAGNFNMRWIASLVAEVYRILTRGGVFLYPRDERKGYQYGRLRLVYEANPIAFLVEHAGGLATDGEFRILDKKPHDLHQRTPLVFGSDDKVELIERYHTAPSHIADRSPLFAKRGLLRT